MNDDESTKPRRKPPIRRTARKWRFFASGMAVVLASGLLAYGDPITANATDSQAPAACVAQPEPPTPPPPLGEPTDTTITTLEQAYWCIFANYYSGPVLDDRGLLLAAFQAFTLELQRRGLDRPTAIMPALAGDRTTDWAAFSSKYSEVIATLPDDATLRQELAIVTLKGMVASLHDDHTHVGSVFLPAGPEPGKLWGLGVHTLPVGGTNAQASPEKISPLYLDFIFSGSPAEAAGLKPGDIIVAVNGMPPYVNGTLSPGVVALLYPQYPNNDKVRVTVQRPATKKTWTVKLTPAALSPDGPSLFSAKLVDGDIAEVQLGAFIPGAADQVLQAIDNLRKEATLRGVILDLRGNNGGDPAEVGKLLSAFVHDKVWTSFCDVRGQCTPNRTDTTTPLLNLPLVALTDRYCASACDAFNNAVKDLKLGQLVGTRTAGIVSGPGIEYVLNDNKTTIGLPKLHSIGANGEVIAGTGVPPDYFAPLTAADLSAGRDPGVDKALELLKA
jgi:carboxyl-terminal processing protease